MTDLSAWFLSVGSFASVVVCTAVAAKAIAGDPARGRRRCPKCWHELAPSAEQAAPLRCTECGHAARNEADVTRTRRAPARAALAIAGVVAIVVATRLRLIDRGPWSMAPTALLFAATPHLADGGYRSAAWELAYRVRSGDADDAQVRRALDLFVDGDPDARPPSGAWRAKYRDLGSAVQARIPRDDPALERLLEIPPVFEVETIPGCRLGERVVPPLLVLDADVWWPPLRQGRLAVKFADGSTREALLAPESRSPSLVLELPSDWTEGDRVELVLAERLAGRADSDRGFRDYPAITVAPSGARTAQAPAWRPIDSDELREAIARVFDEGLMLWEEGTPRGGLRFNHHVLADARFDGVAIGLRIEVLENGVPRRTSRMWWRAGSIPTMPRWLPAIEEEDALGRLHGLVRAGGLEEGRGLEEGGSAGSRWTLRISGDEGLARYALGADLPEPAFAGSTETSPQGMHDGASSIPSDFKYWFGGVLTRELRVSAQPGPSPARRWVPR